MERTSWRNHSPSRHPFFRKRLTWDEIIERYRYEWVCLVEIDKIDDGFEVNSARVVGHGKARQEALDQARPFHTQVPTPDHEIAPYFSRLFAPPKRQVALAWETPESVGAPFISEPLTWEQICTQMREERIFPYCRCELSPYALVHLKASASLLLCP